MVHSASQNTHRATVPPVVAAPAVRVPGDMSVPVAQEMTSMLANGYCRRAALEDAATAAGLIDSRRVVGNFLVANRSLLLRRGPMCKAEWRWNRPA